MLRRKNYFIKKGFQLNFTYKFLILLLLEAVLIAMLFMYLSSDTLTTGYSDSVLTIERTPVFFLTPFLIIILIVAVAMGITGMVVFTMLSHRIAGPLYRFEKDLGDVGSGDLTKRINLRKTDQLTELKESLNLVIDSLDRRIARIKDCALELEQLLSKKDSPEKAEDIYRALNHLKDEIDHFKVTPGAGE